MNSKHKIGPYIYIGIVLVFLYMPLVVMILMGLNKSPLYTLPIEWDLVWFKNLMQNDRLLQASTNSIILALAVSVTATFLGTLAAWAMARYRFKGKPLLQALLVPPISIPWLIIAIALLLMFFWIGVPRDYSPCISAMWESPYPM